MTNTTCPDAFLSPFAVEEAVARALAGISAGPAM